MKKTIITALALISACSAAQTFADANGSVGLTGELSSIKGNNAKFNEYRSIGDGVKLDFDVSAYFDDIYLNFDGSNLGYNNSNKEHYYDDLSVSFKGGKFESSKFHLNYNEIPHNLTFGASTYFSGAGSNVLTAPIATTALIGATQAAYTKSFDYGVSRKNIGAGLELSLKTPFFISVDFDQTQTDGTMPLGIYNGSWGSAAAKEIPVPAEFTTKNVTLQTGYRSNNLIVTLDGLISEFSNSNQTLTYTYTNAQTAVAGWNNRNTVYLAPENSYFKVGGSMMYRMPFLESTLMARASHSQSENNIPMPELGNANFSGKLQYTTASISLASNPLKGLSTSIFYNYLDKQNSSTDSFAYGNNAALHPVKGTALNLTEKFDYHKQNAGFSAGYKLPLKTIISAGYEYLRYDRGVRTDASDTTDHSAFVQLKNDQLDWLAAKLRYQYLTRKSTNLNEYYLTTSTPTMEMYFRPADTADKDQHSIKTSFEIEPVHDLSFGFEYGYKYNKYKNYVLGMMDDSRHEMYADANYAFNMFKLNPYFDLELVEAKSRHRVGNASVFAAPTTGAYNWQSDRKDVNYAVGINVDADIIKDKLTSRIGWSYEKADGSEDFTGEGINLSTLGTPVVNNAAVDDYTKQTVRANLSYMVNKNIKIGLNYLYERFNYSDDHYNGYVNVPTATTHFTGAYANPNYEAHVGYMTVAYKF
jgi:MtrB/PioB family decaheme-associated outer membrane protein